MPGIDLGLHPLNLVVIPGTFAICRLNPDQPIPSWASTGDLFSVTRTAEELSVVCRQKDVPEGVQVERDWGCMRVAGTLPFMLSGILASILQPLAEAGISVFAISTFDSDYLLVKQHAFPSAVDVLRLHGHTVS
jgi:hypothetical protein